MNILVLGAYGLIGREIALALLAQGHSVVGLARSAAKGAALVPHLRWIEADIATLLTPERWQPHLAGIDAVVNAAGALQSGPRDRLGDLQRTAIVALVAAMDRPGSDRPLKFVQISAPGAAPDAATEFMRTKGEGDAALTASGLDWTILRPGLVIAPTAYGGTSLIRMLAAFPVLQPIASGDSLVQTVDVADVARATVRALTEPALSRQAFDLVEPSPHRLADIVLAFRRWLGFAPPAAVVAVPAVAAGLLAWLADLAGLLGWRSPLRSTAIRVLAEDVRGDPEPWRRATGETLASLDETLQRLPSTRQERVYARSELAFPLLLGGFAVFWIASGVIGLAERDAAAALVAPRLGEALALASVLAGSALDIAVGAALLVQRWCRPALLASLAVAAGYLALGTVLTPALWADPLGPLVKIVPVMGLAVALLAHVGER